MKYPVVLGHEFCGVISRVGRGVTGWNEGDRVVSETAAVIDLNSPLTREGRYNLDPNRRGYGAIIDGAMRRYVPVPARILHRMPPGLAFEQAALTEPCCVAFNAVVGNAHIRPGDRVVVLGPGPIGVLCAAVAKLCGAEVAIVGLENDRPRLEVAKQYGCEAIVGDAAGRLDQQGGLGAAAGKFLARSASTEEHHVARQLQPQLANLGASDSVDCDGHARCTTDHRRCVASFALERSV
jgi:alcohol dehydrogenase/L-iditol 2-dehydrogenase